MQVIIFPNDNGGVAVIVPAPEFADQLDAIAAKDVPEGKPWRIVDADDLPPSESRNAWQWTSTGPLTVGAPQPAPVPDLSFAQLMIGLVSEGWITTAEGEAWLTGTLPAPVVALIGTLPAGQQFPAKARALRPTIVERTDPLVSALGAAQGKTPEQLDDFFRTYAAI
jgi:hypothetical protein